MADLEVKQVNTLPKNSVVLTDYLLAIGSTEEYQAKVQDVVLAGLENYKKKYITGYNTNLSIVEAINLIYNLKNDTETKDGLAAVRALLGEASPDASLGIQSTTISEALNEVTDKLNSHINSYNNAISGINNKIGSADLQVGTTVIGAINALNKSLNDHKEQQVIDLRNMNDSITSAANNASSALNKATTNENSITAINNKIGSSSMGTTATTITGAIAEIRKLASDTSAEMSSFDITTDKTLKLENKAADAKIVGDRLDTVEATANNAASTASDASAAVASLTDTVNNLDMSGEYANNLLYDPDTGKLQAAYNNKRLGNPVTILGGSGESGGVAFDGGGYYEENGSNYLYFTKDGDRLEDVSPIPLPAGGGGGGAAGGSEILVMKSTTATKFSVLTGAQSVPIGINLYIKDSEGNQSTNGIATVSIVNTTSGMTLNTITVNLGESTIDVARYIKSGTNSFRLEAVTESSEGQELSANKRYTITAESFALEWNLNDGVYVNPNTELQVQVSQTGNGTKTIYLVVDDNTSTRLSKETVVTSSTESFTLRLGVNAVHKLELYGIMESDSISIESEHLVAYVAQKSSSGNDFLLAVNYDETEVGQYDTINIPFIVSKPANATVDVSMYINGELFRTIEDVDELPHSFAYRTTQQGTLSLTIFAIYGSTERAWDHTLTVTQLSGGDAVSETTTGLIYKLDPNSMSTSDLSLYVNNGISLTPSEDFNTINGGLTTDDEGISCIRVMRGDRLTINHRLFADDPLSGNGLEFKFIYKIENSTLINAPAIMCYEGGTDENPYSGIGLRIETNGVYLDSRDKKGASGWRQNMCEGEKVELDVNICSKNSLQSPNIIMLWESGAPAYGNLYEDDSISHNYASPQNIVIGSDYCDVIIYLVRIYNRELNRMEILNNFICDGSTREEIDARLTRNQIYTNGKIDPVKVAEQNPDLIVLEWQSPEGCSFSKQDERYGVLRYMHVNGGAKGNWVAGLESDKKTYLREHAVIQKVQGTSSTQYITAGANFDFNFVNKLDGKYNVPLRYDDESIDDAVGFQFTDNSIPVKYINYKCNVASQEHANNTVLADWYNKYQPYIRPARQNDPRVRDTVEGYPCVLFYTNTGDQDVYIDKTENGVKRVSPGETVLYGVGDLNNSKKNSEVFGTDDEDNMYVVEVDYNTYPPCLFRLYGEDPDSQTGEKREFSIDGDEWDKYYEFRYINANDDPDTQTAEDIAKIEAGKEAWRTLVKWVWSCAPDMATDSVLSPAVTYGTTTYRRDTQEYRIAKWKNEASNYIEMDSLLYHHVFTEVFNMIDNRAKNTFWCYSKKTNKWNINFGYDFDTAFGTDNKGREVFSYSKIDSDGNVFNASTSVPFVLNKLAFTNGDGFNPELSGERMTEMYRRFENSAFNLSAISDRIEEDQRKICEALWIEDTWVKDVITANNNDTQYIKEMTNGRKRLQRKYWCKFRQVFMNSYYFGSGFISDKITWRAWTPKTSGRTEEEANKIVASLKVVPSRAISSITPYCDMFVGMSTGTNTYMRGRTTANTPVTLDFHQTGFDEFEGVICGASYISSFGDLATYYPSSVVLSRAVRLREANIGSSIEGYYNPFNPDVNFSSCKGLEKINMEGVAGHTTQINLSNNLYVTELLTRNSNASSVSFASGGKLEVAKLNAVGNITANKLKYVKTFTLQGYDNLTQLVVTDSPKIDTLAMVINGSNINRVRLTNIDWSTTDTIYDVLKRLNSAGGVTATGANSGPRVITGSVFIDSITGDKLNELRTMYGDDITFTTGAETGTYTVKFFSDNTKSNLLKTYTIDEGKPCPNPLNATIVGNQTVYSDGDIEVPTKEPDDDYQYTFNGWSSDWQQASTAVNRNYEIYGVYKQSVRINTVQFVDYDGSVKQTKSVEAHGSTAYTGSDLTRPGGYIWLGWLDENGEEVYSIENVIRDRVFTANYVYPTEPEEVKVLRNFDYAYSDDPTDNSAYNRGQIYSIFDLGRAEQYGFAAGALGAKIKMRIPQQMITDGVVDNRYIVWEYVSKGHYELVSGGGSNGDWVMKGLLSKRMNMSSGQNTTGGWGQSAIRQWANTSFYQPLDPFWRRFFKQHKTLATAGGTSSSIVASNDYFNILSCAEVGLLPNDTPYQDEVWLGASEKTFSIFTNNTTRIRGQMNDYGEYVYSDGSTGITYWLRSVKLIGPVVDSTAFAYVAATGRVNQDVGYPYSTNAYGVMLVGCC